MIAVPVPGEDPVMGYLVAFTALAAMLLAVLAQAAMEASCTASRRSRDAGELPWQDSTNTVPDENIIR